MGSKLSGKFEAAGRAGVRNKRTKELVAVYPYRVWGTDADIEREVHDWFYVRNREKGIQTIDYFVDTLSPVELKTAQEQFRN